MSKKVESILAHPVRTLNEDQIELVSGGKGGIAQDAHAKAMCSSEASH